MKALVKSKAEPGLWMEDVEIPTVGPNDVLVKIKKTSICGTDVHIYIWDEWAQHHIKVPQTIGHEFVGEVVEIGKEVKSYFQIGDRVSGEGHIPCGHCRNCRAGRAHLCRINVSVGVTRDGCFAEYLSIPASNAYPVPADIPDDQAAILDPLGNAIHTCLSFNLVGEDVLINGAGPIGLMATAIAKLIGARYVVTTDVNPYRLALAEKMGATLAIDSAKTSLQTVMNQLNMKEGFDVGMEMSGNPHAFNNMIEFMNHAGKIALLGFMPPQTAIDWSKVVMKGIIIKGIYGREMFDTWYKMINLLQDGLDITPIITHDFNVDDYQQAFAIMRSGKAGKVILNWEQ